MSWMTWCYIALKQLHLDAKLKNFIQDLLTESRERILVYGGALELELQLIYLSLERN